MSVEREHLKSLQGPDIHESEESGNAEESGKSEESLSNEKSLTSEDVDCSLYADGEERGGIKLDPKGHSLADLLDDVVELRGVDAEQRKPRQSNAHTMPGTITRIGFATDPVIELAISTMPKAKHQDVLATIPLWPYGDRQMSSDKDFVVPLERQRTNSNWAEANTESEKLVQKFLMVWIGAVLIFSLHHLFSSRTDGGFFYFWQFFFGLAFVVAMRICRSTRGCSFISMTKWHLNFLWVLDKSLEKKESFDWSSLRYVTLEPQHFLRKPKIRFQFYGGTSMLIPLESFPSRDRWKSFLEIASELAPQAKFDFRIGESLMPDARDASYTELWLEALASVPKRERLLPLFDGQVLNQGKYAVIRELGVGGQGTAYLSRRVDRKSALVSGIASGGNGTKLDTSSGGEESADTEFDSTNGGKFSDTESDGAHGGKRTKGTEHDGANGGKSSEAPEDFVVLKEYMLPVYVDMKARKQALERFESEARMLGRLMHESIVKLLDFFVEDHRAYLVLEYIPGDSLRRRVEKNGPISEDEAVALGLGMCEILEYLQEQTPPVVHRDFTPDNLLENNHGRVKLIDFMVAQEGENNTVTSAVVGKQSYMPPEQFRGNASVRSDIYACGATLYFLLTGEDPEALSPSLVHLKRQDISNQLAETIMKATALEEAERFANAAQLRDALSTCTPSARNKVDPLTSDALPDVSSEKSSE